MEKLTGRSETKYTSLEKADFLRRQGLFITNIVRDLNLDGILVNSEPEMRDTGYFKTRKTLAFSGVNDYSVATVLSGGESSSLTIMLIMPTDTGSGILVDDTTKTIWTDSFWVLENGVFKYIRPTGPVPVDGLCAIFDLRRNDPIINTHTEANNILFALADDKQKTKEVLEKAGIRVPRGIFLMPGDDIEKEIDLFIRTNSGMQGLVMKENHGSLGRGVSIFDMEEAGILKSRARRKIYSGFNAPDLIIEERIIPPSELLAIDGAEGQEFDYNFRVITTLDRDNPQVVDAEIRYRQKDDFDKPVNLAIDASAARTTALKDNSLVEKAFITAREATKAICKEVLDPGEMVLGIAGVDLINRDDIYGIEVNTGSVGGFSTLVKLDKKPLGTVKDILIPAFLPYLGDHFAKRADVGSGNLRRLPYNASDYLALYRTMRLVEDYETAAKVLLEFGDKFPEDRGYIKYITGNLVYIGGMIGNLDIALDYIDKTLRQMPDNIDAITWKVFIMRQTKRYQEEDKILEGLQNAVIYSPELLWEVFLLRLIQDRVDVGINMLKEKAALDAIELSDAELYAFVRDGYKELRDEEKSSFWQAKIIAVLKE